MLELARECALEVREAAARLVLPPGRGRGSSVGSIVCYLTGLSHVAVAAGLSLGRFLNDELSGVPDIDLDFPRDIREKLIVRVTERYGHDHAALVASFATYRSRGAIRDVGKALGLPYAELERLARVSDGWNARRIREELKHVPGPRRGGGLAALARLRRGDVRIAGLPRHISQHPGGMVISSRPLVDLVPVMPAAMAGTAGSPSGTRTPATTRASSRSTCSASGCSPPSRTAWSRSRARAARRSTSRASGSTT